MPLPESRQGRVQGARTYDMLHVIIRTLDKMQYACSRHPFLTVYSAAGGVTIRQPPRLLLGGSVYRLRLNAALRIFQLSA